MIQQAFPDSDRRRRRNSRVGNFGLWRKIRAVGPALVLAAVVLGPGSITLCTMAGSLYGYSLLWVPVAATIFMIAFTWMSARIALVTRMTVLEASRSRFGSGITRLGGLFGFLAICAFQAGNSAAVGFAGDALFGIGPRFWAAVLFVPAMIFILLPNLYGKLEILVKCVVGLMVIAFVGTVAVVGVDWRAAVPGIVPSFPEPAAVFLALGMAATTFSIAAAVFQSHLMREKDWGPEDLSTESVDSFIGIAILGGISVLVLFTSAGVLFGQGTLFTAETMARQLEPLAGPAAFYLFIWGFFFAGFSSLIVNPLIGATLLVDGFGGNASMDGRAVKVWTVAALAIGLGVVMIFGSSPIELLRFAQTAAVVAFPILGFLVLALAADRNVMGRHANSIGVNLLGALGYLTIVGIALNYLRLTAQTFLE